MFGRAGDVRAITTITVVVATTSVTATTVIMQATKPRSDTAWIPSARSAQACVAAGATAVAAAAGDTAVIVTGTRAGAAVAVMAAEAEAVKVVAGKREAKREDSVPKNLVTRMEDGIPSIPSIILTTAGIAKQRRSWKRIEETDDLHPSYFQPSGSWPGPIPGTPLYARRFEDCFEDGDWAEPDSFDLQNSYSDNPYLYHAGIDFHPIDWAERAVRHGERFVDRQSHEWAEATKHAADSAANGLRDAANRMAEIPEKSTKEIADTMKTIAVIGVVGVAGIVLLTAVLK